MKAIHNKDYSVVKTFSASTIFGAFFFDLKNRSTNASAESFNSKIKKFRTNFRGVRDKSFFLFRLKNIFA